MPQRYHKYLSFFRSCLRPADHGRSNGFCSSAAVKRHMFHTFRVAQATAWVSVPTAPHHFRQCGRRSPRRMPQFFFFYEQALICARQTSDRDLETQRHEKVNVRICARPTTHHDPLSDIPDKKKEKVKEKRKRKRQGQRLRQREKLQICSCRYFCYRPYFLEFLKIL